MKSIVINDSGHLVFTLDDNTVLDAGYVMGSTGPRGYKGEQGMAGAPGLDSPYGCTGATGPCGSSLVCIQTCHDSRSFTLVMSDGKRISVPINSILGNTPTGPTGPCGNGVKDVAVSSGEMLITMTDGSSRTVELETNVRTLPFKRDGSMPLYYDPVSKIIYAVNNKDDQSRTN